VRKIPRPSFATPWLIFRTHLIPGRCPGLDSAAAPRLNRDATFAASKCLDFISIIPNLHRSASEEGDQNPPLLKIHHYSGSSPTINVGQQALTAVARIFRRSEALEDSSRASMHNSTRATNFF
jgi:hypothetical protein